MSLVEKALQKIQATRSTSVQPTAQPVLPVAKKGSASPLEAPTPTRELDAQDLRSGDVKLLRIDRDRLREAQMLPAKTEEREMADQFRAIKRPLLDHAANEDEDETTRRLIVVASALPADGKTFTSLNLALSLAMEKKIHVLLVDADAPKRHLTRTLGLPNAPGLLDVLADPNRSIEDVIAPTDVPCLDFLPVGTWTDTTTELLASGRMRDVVHRLSAIYRRGVVLFDSPPVLLTNESRSLGMIAGQIVLVVKAGVTPQQAVKDAVEALGKDRRISLVLNNAELGGALGYYYGYRYGYEANRNETDSSQS